MTTFTSDFFPLNTASGVLGLAYDTLSTNKLTTFLDKVNDSQKSFSVVYKDANEGGSYLMMGGYDDDVYQPASYHKVL